MNLDTDDDDNTFYYEVEKILDMQVQGSTNWFFIKWKNYDESWFVLYIKIRRRKVRDLFFGFN